jgi:hypothetical protein
MTLWKFPAGFTASSDSAGPVRSSSTGFSVWGLSCGESTVHRLKPVLHMTSIHRNAIRHSKLRSQNRFIKDL